MKYLVIDVGGTFVKYAVMDEQCRFYKKDRIPVASDTQERFLQMLTDIYEENKEGICGIAVSCAGIIDSTNGILHTGGSLTGISELPAAGILEERCGLPVTVENDARCAALAELWKGSLQGVKDAVVMILGTAVGGALILDGKVWKGSSLTAGEFSYLLTDSKDALNPKNTLAARGGVPALIRLAAESTGTAAESLSGEKIFSMAEDGDERMLECIRSYAGMLAVQIMNCRFMTDPEKIAVGGGISAQPMLLSMIREELTKLNGVYPHSFPLPEVTACRFFNDSNLIGALYVHLAQKEGIYGP